MNSNLNVFLKENNNLSREEINIEISYSDKNKNIQHFIDYLNYYTVNYKNKVFVLNNDNTLLEIDYKDIIIFYSDKKNNFCRVKDNCYMIKSKLYELENIGLDFIRISKSCIVNIKHVEKFDIGETGKIVVKLDDGTEQVVSRRKTTEIMRFLEKRRI